LEFTQVTKQS
jgi:predicted component of type VI protein secretion system